MTDLFNQPEPTTKAAARKIRKDATRQLVLDCLAFGWPQPFIAEQLGASAATLRDRAKRTDDPMVTELLMRMSKLV